MDFGLLLDSLSYAIETPKKLRKLVEGDMVEILLELGDRHYKSALLALRDMRSSQHPAREVESAITSLRTAYQFYDSHSTNSILRYGLVNAGYGPKEHKKACEVACLIASCYAYLGELKLAREYLDHSKAHFNKYESEFLELERQQRGGSPLVRYSGFTGILTEWFSPMEKIERRVRLEKEKYNMFFSKALTGVIKGWENDL